MADQSKSVKFGYDIEVTFVYKDKTYEIMKENISNLVINREYILKNMPTMYLSFKVNPKLYNLIVNNSTKATFIVKILKYDTTTKVISKKNYINLEFNYKTNKKPDNMITTEDSDFTEEAIKNDLYKLTVGLFLNSIVENNKKKIINNIFKNNNTVSIIHYYTSHMKMLIEAFDNNRTIPNLIIEPTESITLLLQYLNQICGFYTTKYLFFMD
jgi:hypothetical protein